MIVAVSLCSSCTGNLWMISTTSTMSKFVAVELAIFMRSFCAWSKAAAHCGCSFRAALVPPNAADLATADTRCGVMDLQPARVIINDEARRAAIRRFLRAVLDPPRNSVNGSYHFPKHASEPRDPAR